MWSPRLPKAPDRPQEPWTSNEQIWREWSDRIERRGKPNTQRNLRVGTRPLFRMFDPVLVTDLNEDDMATFVATIEKKCSRLLNGAKPKCRRSRDFDINACPFVTGNPVDTCPGYKPLQIGGTWAYICAINRLYDWLLVIGRVKMNPMLPVFHDFRSKHAAEFDDLVNNPRRRALTLDDVRTLVLGSPPNHAIGYLLAAKCYLRIHEVLLLTFDPRYCNIDEGWMIIPPAPPGEPRKRKGNSLIILDAEARAWLRWYRDTWWSAKVKRDEHGVPLTQEVMLTTFGMPWGANAEGNFCQGALHKDAERLGLMTGQEEAREQRINTHCFRAFATTWSRDRKIPDVDLALVRGDKIPGAVGRYDHYRPRLPRIYDEYAPVLGISPP